MFHYSNEKKPKDSNVNIFIKMDDTADWSKSICWYPEDIDLLRNDIEQLHSSVKSPYKINLALLVEPKKTGDDWHQRQFDEQFIDTANSINIIKCSRIRPRGWKSIIDAIFAESAILRSSPLPVWLGCQQKFVYKDRTRKNKIVTANGSVKKDRRDSGTVLYNMQRSIYNWAKWNDFNVLNFKIKNDKNHSIPGDDYIMVQRLFDVLYTGSYNYLLKEKSHGIPQLIDIVGQVIQTGKVTLVKDREELKKRLDFVYANATEPDWYTPISFRYKGRNVYGYSRKPERNWSGYMNHNRQNFDKLLDRSDEELAQVITALEDNLTGVVRKHLDGLVGKRLY